MKIGLIGLSGVGKTTIFNLLTHTNAATGSYEQKMINIGMAKSTGSKNGFLD